MAKRYRLKSVLLSLDQEAEFADGTDLAAGLVGFAGCFAGAEIGEGLDQFRQHGGRRDRNVVRARRGPAW